MLVNFQRLSSNSCSSRMRGKLFDAVLSMTPAFASWRNLSRVCKLVFPWICLGWQLFTFPFVDMLTVGKEHAVFVAQTCGIGAYTVVQCINIYIVGPKAILPFPTFPRMKDGLVNFFMLKLFYTCVDVNLSTFPHFPCFFLSLIYSSSWTSCRMIQITGDLI